MVIGRVIAAWPSFALIGAYEMLMWQVRQSTAVRQAAGDDGARIGAGAGAGAGEAEVRHLELISPRLRRSGKLPLCRVATPGNVPGNFNGKPGSGQSATGSLPVTCRPVRQSPRRSAAVPGGGGWS
jgi:hypothetical protein